HFTSNSTSFPTRRSSDLEMIHHSYPVIFGRALNFTLPSESEGVSIEADMERSTIIFPLGPALHLSWADCNSRVNPDRSKVYRCRSEEHTSELQSRFDLVC